MVSAIERREAKAAELEGRNYAPVTERGAAVQAARQERALLAELRTWLELAREIYVHARDEGEDRVTAGPAALRAAAQKHGIDRERDVSGERGHAAEPESIRERLAHIAERGIGSKEVEVVRETGPEHGREDICARLGRILGREAGQDHEEPEVGGSESGPESRSIRERLQEALTRTKQVVRKESGHEREEDVRHRDREDGHEL